MHIHHIREELAIGVNSGKRTYFRSSSTSTGLVRSMYDGSPQHDVVASSSSDGPADCMLRGGEPGRFGAV
jgi:hypothetical protein